MEMTSWFGRDDTSLTLLAVHPGPSELSFASPTNHGARAGRPPPSIGDLQSYTHPQPAAAATFFFFDRNHPK